MGDEHREDGAWYLRGFRRAREASAGWNVFKTLAHTSLFWGVFLFVLPWQLTRLERWWGIAGYSFPTQSWSPWVGFALMGALGLWSGVTMALVGRGTPLPLDFPNRLVVRGPYRFVRNPMAIAGLSQGAFVGLYLGSWLVLVYVVAGGLIWNALARPPEEHHLTLEFGEEYERYTRNVRCWIPRLTPYRPEDVRT